MMGKVGVLFKIYAEEGKEEEVEKNIASELKPNGIQLDDIGFGIRVIKALFIHEDSEGSGSIEEKLRKISGVREVEVEEETLI